MKVLLRMLGILFAIALVLLALFALFGEPLQRVDYAQRFAELRPYAWAIAIGLLISDLILPIPATGVMAALGSVYGVLVGAIIGAAGSAASAAVAYWLARSLGQRGSRLIASGDELERFRRTFERWGGAAIVVSRALPILPEALSVLAGLARMQFKKFMLAVVLGTIPTAAVFAYVGAASVKNPAAGVLLAAVIPLAVWPIFLKFLNNEKHSN